MTYNTLAQLVGRIAQSDGDYTTPIPALTAYRRSSASAPMVCIYGLSLALTVQGGKRVVLGEEDFDYGPGQSLITTVDLPVTSYVTRASAQEPFLCLRLDLDAHAVAQLAAEMDFAQALQEPSTRAMSVVTLDAGLLEAVTRLFRLLDEPSLIPRIAPLVQQEIAVRLLNGPHGQTLRHLVTVGSPGHHVAKVIAWIRQNFAEAVSVDELAAKAYMSPSTFRQHFRSVAGMSPLQYLKKLRLQEARSLMMNQRLDAGSAALRVGYESASQFSREYRRLFGEPPQRDVQRLRDLSLSAA